MDKKIKICYYDVENNVAVESLWGSKEGEFYRIKNIPFFAPNLSYNDLVRVELDDNELYFDELVEASGHSTIQIIIFIETEINRVIKELETLGCHWEGMNDQKYLSVDISPRLEYKMVKLFLEAEASKSVLDYKESCLPTGIRS